MVTILPCQGKNPHGRAGIFFLCAIVDRFDSFFYLFNLLVAQVTNMGQIILLPLPKEGML
jgi:thiamine pyrophosphokinase